MRSSVTIAMVLFGCGAAASDCGKDVAELRRLSGDPSFPLQWTEVGMDDGKPLVLELRDRGGSLHIRLAKTHEGLWAEGTGTVCVIRGGLEIRFDAGQLHPGPAANWLLRQSLQASGRLTFTRPAADDMKVSA
jgi:hypothetical protein